MTSISPSSPTSSTEAIAPGPTEQPSALLSKLVREPLLHFVLLGALLFSLYFNVAGPSVPAVADNQHQIDVSAPVLESLKNTWQFQWRRAPTPEELQRLIDNYIRDQGLYREALALGLDQNDVEFWGDRHREIFLGPERAERISPAKSAIDRGMKFTLHHDAPIAGIGMLPEDIPTPAV